MTTSAARGRVSRARSLALLLMSVTLTGCPSGNITFLDPQGPIAAAQRWHLLEVVVLVMIVVLPVLVLTPLLAWRYRYGNKAARYTPKWSFSWPLEFLIWGVPVAVVVVLGVLLWRSTQALDPYAPLPSDAEPMQVQVVGLDWEWLFIYPEEGVASVGELTFPADRPLALELTSDTVMQSFFIPALGSQIYAMAGMVTKLQLAAYGPGAFRGDNTQYNGTGFQKQKFVARGMAPAAFDAWVKSARADGIPLDEATYRTLCRKSTTQEAREALASSVMPPGVVFFTDVAPGLFDAIVEKYRKGSAGQAGRTAMGNAR